MTTLSTSAGTVAYDSRGSGDPVVLAGSSVGGNVAIRLAIRRPDLVKGLVTTDGGGFEGSRVSGRVFCALMSRPWFARRVYPLFSRAYMRPRTADHRARASAIAITRTAPGVRAVTEMWHSFNLPEHDLRTQAGKITAPTVLAWGRHDPILPLRAAETARDLIPGSRLVVIDSGHLPHTTSPAAVATELTSLANTAFDTGSQVNDAADNPPATKEQQQ
jgi:pimeloyl-ACP methyl ester carboxylesterase